MEQAKTGNKENSNYQFGSTTTTTYIRHQPKIKTISDFMPTKQEKIALTELKEEMDVYMLQKVAVATS